MKSPLAYRIGFVVFCALVLLYLFDVGTRYFINVHACSYIGL